MAHIRMFSRLGRLVEFDLELVIDVAILHQISSEQVDHVPLVEAILERFDLRLINRLPAVRTDLLAHEEKALASASQFRFRPHNDLFRSAEFLLLSCDSDHAVFVLTPLRIYKWPLQCLISGRHDLVQRKFEAPDKVVLREVHQRIWIVNVVHINLESLAHLKVVLHVELLDPLRIQVVHYNLSDSDPVPRLGPSQLRKHQHPVRACKCIHVWQILASKGETNSLDKPGLPRFD